MAAAIADAKPLSRRLGRLTPSPFPAGLGERPGQTPSRQVPCRTGVRQSANAAGVVPWVLPFAWISRSCCEQRQEVSGEATARRELGHGEPGAHTTAARWQQPAGGAELLGLCSASPQGSCRSQSWAPSRCPEHSPALPADTAPGGCSRAAGPWRRAPSLCQSRWGGHPSVPCGSSWQVGTSHAVAGCVSRWLAALGAAEAQPSAYRTDVCAGQSHRSAPDR